MSSDSEEDCYGNIAQKLQKIKSQFIAEIDSSKDTPTKADENHSKINESSAEVTCVELKDDSDCDEISLDTIIAQNTKKKSVRRSKRKADISVDNIIKTFRSKRTTRNSRKCADFGDLDVTVENASDVLSAVKTLGLAEDFAIKSGSRGKGRGGRRGRGRRGAKTTCNTTTNQSNVNSSTNLGVSTLDSNTGNETISSPVLRSSRRGHRGRLSNAHRGRLTSHQVLLNALGAPRNQNTYYPTYSVGNTDEYPDESYNQPLFNSNQKEKEDVVVVESELPVNLNESLEVNEELSVKVYWQSRECVKFTIRRFQKLQTVFDFFANREKVSADKLFFTYNDKILIKDDTPDSISYNEVKFIDGGIVHQSVSNIVCNDQETTKSNVKNGIKLKFQCQNVKKPYEVYVKPEDKLATVMMQYAEHLEMPLDKLKFLFDGDLITGKNTPKQLELEGGECIDVIIIS